MDPRDAKLLELVRLLKSEEFAKSRKKEEKKKNMRMIDTGEELVKYVAEFGNDAAITLRFVVPGTEFQEEPDYADRDAYVGHHVDVVGTLVWSCQWEDDSIEDDLIPLSWNGVAFRMADNTKVLVAKND